MEKAFTEHFRALLLKNPNFKNISKCRNIQLFLFWRPKLLLSNYQLLTKGKKFQAPEQQRIFHSRSASGKNPRGVPALARAPWDPLPEGPPAPAPPAATSMWLLMPCLCKLLPALMCWHLPLTRRIYQAMQFFPCKVGKKEKSSALGLLSFSKEMFSIRTLLPLLSRLCVTTGKENGKNSDLSAFN